MTNDAPEAIIAAIPEDTPVDGEVLLEKLNHQIVKVKRTTKMTYCSGKKMYNIDNYLAQVVENLLVCYLIAFYSFVGHG